MRISFQQSLFFLNVAVGVAVHTNYDSDEVLLALRL